MNRFTSPKESHYEVEPSFINDAIYRLGKFEDMHDSLFSELEEINQKLAYFHREQMTKTLSYKEAFTRKLMLIQMIHYLTSKGLNHE